ncbi:hypothetical protein F2A31_13440 [Acinetobacter suaedae]|uniref:Lipoprotein n=1 Tax=Acinetobacter suaedae TaxID=2609668 RepID=A0A5P1UV78_9GAMM|nr:hypothetical protein [Acinetobacter sp. C16S1]QER40645.1 hypothetical protein F2A31_13440 [Acinetobacter sp. C16S1]
MKTPMLSLLFCSLAMLLVACGENFSASNVSLGGSGSGHQKPPNPTGGDSIPSHDEKDEIYTVVIPKMESNECEGIQRNVHFIFNDSKQAAPVGVILDVPSIGLQFEVKNTTSNYIFERADQCKPFKIQKNNVTFTRSPFPTCGIDQHSVQVFQPYETKIYTFNLDFINAAQQWEVSYLVSYGKELPSPKAQWDKCTPLEITFPIRKRKLQILMNEENQQQQPTQPKTSSEKILF